MRAPSLIALLAAATLGSLSGCGGTRYANRSPTGEPFPPVTGTALSGEDVRVPDAFRGAPLVLLVGFDQDAQFDADRWLLGLLQSGTTVAVRELPTIPGFLPRLFSGQIDSGMRGGIPEEDWGAVITVYGDGDEVARFTGNEQDNNIRALLLDAEGRVVFFHDRGYSPGTLLRLLEVLATLRA